MLLESFECLCYSDGQAEGGGDMAAKGCKLYLIFRKNDECPLGELFNVGADKVGIDRFATKAMIESLRNSINCLSDLFKV